MKKVLALLVLALLLVGGCTPTVEAPPDPIATITAPPGQPTPTTTPELPPPTVATLALCGDVMGHMPVTNDAWDEVAGKYDYTPIMGGALPYIAAADYAAVNLETVLGGGPKYTGFPNFNSPDGLAHSLKDAGFDLALTANNHSLDRGDKGLVRTLDVLDKAGLSHVGTYREGEEHAHIVADVGGISVAFLGYTYGTNGNPLPREGSVNVFNTDYMTYQVNPDSERVLADLEEARALDTDLIAVMVHWGLEYQLEQNKHQEAFADLLIAGGADMVLGGHSHTPQPMELRTVAGEDGAEHTGFVAYSLGNFLSSQYMEYTYITAVLTVELEKDNVTGEAGVASWSYAPMYTINRGAGAERRFELLDVEKSLKTEPEGALKAELEKAAADCEMIFGPREVTVE